MTESPCRNWTDARREPWDRAFAVLSLDTIPVAIGGIVSRHLGPEMWLMGIGVAAWVTLCFAVLILGDLALRCVLGCWWNTRRGR